MNELVEFTLGIEAISYISDCLKYGNSLSERILKNINLKKGDVKTYLPCNTQAEMISEFHYGGKFTNFKGNFETGGKTIEDPDEYLYSQIEIQLKKGKTCIIENSVAKAGDEWLSTLDTRLLFFHDEVYHIFTEKDIGNNNVKNNLLRIKFDPIFVGVVTALPTDAIIPFCNKGVISTEGLETIADRILKLFVGVYDGESYIIWSKK